MPTPTIEDALSAPRKIIVDPKRGSIAEALRAAVPHETCILLRPGEHVLNERNRFPDGVHLVGHEGWGFHGRKSKIINRHLGQDRFPIGLVPGNHCYLGYFDALNQSEDPNRMQAFIGNYAYSDNPDPPATGVTIERIDAEGETDWLYLIANAVSEWTARWIRGFSRWDFIVIRDGARNEAPASHIFTLSHSSIEVIGPSAYRPNPATPDAPARCVVIDAGAATIQDCYLSASGSRWQNCGLSLLDHGPADAIVHLINTPIDAEQKWHCESNTTLIRDGVQVHPVAEPKLPPFDPSAT